MRDFLKVLKEGLGLVVLMAMFVAGLVGYASWSVNQ